MLKRTVAAAIFTVVTFSGCQGSSTATAGPVAATRAAASQPEALPPYSRENALKLYRAGKYKQDEAMCLKAIAEIEKEKGEKAPELASPLDDLAMAYLRQARYKDAGPLIERAESVLDKEIPEQAIMYARLCINKGWRLYAMGDTRGAERIFTDGRDLLQKHQKEEGLVLAELINNLALMLDDMIPGERPNPRRITQARLLLYKSWQMRKKLAGEESFEAQESLNNIGMHLLYHGDGDDSTETAINTLKKSVELAEKLYGKDNPETAMSHVNLALALKITEEDDAAEDHLKIAMPITEKFLGKTHPDRAYQLEVLGQIEQSRGNFKEAEAHYLEALRISEATYGTSHEHVAGPLGSLRELYQETDEKTKLQAIQKRIEKIRGKEI